MRNELVPMKHIIEIKLLHNIHDIDYKFKKILLVIIRIIYCLVHEHPDASKSSHNIIFI